MTPTKLIAGLMGPVMLAIGIAVLINGDLFPAMAAQLTQNYGIIFIAGAMTLLAGIAIVRVHNVWSGGWPVLVTVLGWFAIVGGLLRMWFPQMAGPIADQIVRQPGAIPMAGIVFAAIGAFLSYKAYAE